MQVEFIVGNIVQHTVENPAGSTFRLNLDISKIEEPESMTVQVGLRDELDRSRKQFHHNQYCRKTR